MTSHTEGWGVAINPVWGWGNVTEERVRELGWASLEDYEDNVEPDVVVEIDVEVVPVSDYVPTRFVGGVRCVQGESGVWYPLSLFRALEDLQTDDTHDLRDRWFATEDEAREHADFTRGRWQSPQPWESFVCLS